MGNKGFWGPASLMYHLRNPTQVRHVKHLRALELESDPDPSVRLRHFYSSRLQASGSAILDRVPLLFNRDVAMLLVRPTQTDTFFFRDSDGDELVYVSAGGGVLESQFGELPFGEGDYLVIPRGALHRYRFNTEAQLLLVFESQGYIRTPERYRNEHGQLLEGAPFSERDIRLPGNLQTIDEPGAFTLLVKRGQNITEVILDHHPFDVVGWDGYYYPWALNIRDFEPIVGRVHQPPPVHQTFQGDGFVICSFCPRPFDFDLLAVPVPYNHANVMADEVLYYASSEFMSRRGIEFGSVTLHPDGLPHGPHPGTVESSLSAKRTEEYAVMMDTIRPLLVAKPVLAVEDPGYQYSWLEER
jgi:homogentisate 1,2-dioxygenase